MTKRRTAGRGAPLPERPAFFGNFSLGRFLFKASGLYIGLLGAGSAFSDYSKPVSDLRDALKAEKWTVFYAFGAWMAVSVLIELVRRKIRHDLAILRYERLKRVRKR